MAGAAWFVLGTGSGAAQDADLARLPIAALEIEQYFTDNVFFSRPLYDQRRRDDWVTVLRPRLGYTHAFEQGQIRFGASAAAGFYARYGSENYLDLNLTTDGQYRFSPSTNAVWGLGLERGHEARNSIEPSDLVGAEPTTYWHPNGFAAVAHRFGDNRIQFGVTYDGYDYADSDTLVAPFVVNQDDRDRDVVTIGGRYTRNLGGGTSVYGETIADIRRYRTAMDDAGYVRDSNGLRSNVGVQTGIGENATGELFAGLLYQDFADPRFATVVVPDFGARFSWSSGATSVDAEIRRSLEETTLGGVSSYLRTTARVQLRQDVAEDLRVYAGAAFADLDFRGSDRRDQVGNVWLGARKYLTPHFYFGLEAGFEEVDSSDPVNDYTETRIMARLGVDTQRAYEEGAKLAAGMTRDAGLYVGAGGEVSFQGTMFDGPRQETRGSLTTDFGGFGAGGYALAGWGIDLDSTYLGAEAGIGVSAARWDHARLPGGRVFSVREQDSVALSLLAGRRLPGGALLYGRAGVRSTEFAIDYATANASAALSERLTGFEYGLGIRTPLSPRFALSAEYSQVRYPDFAARAGHGHNAVPDRFANVGGKFRTALTYHFGGIAGAGGEAVIPDLSGWYWGVQAGAGALSSLTEGDREPEGVPPVVSVLTADFGDTGFTAGGLVGYNHQVDRFVFGAELEADLARRSWQHQRQPSGRTFSLGEDATLAASARAGYLLQSGTLLYARLGAAATHFQHDFSTTGASISKDVWRGGLRYGAGMEVPLTDRSRVRMDFSFTDYGTLTLDTPPGPETYDTAEAAFRIGYLRNF